MHIPPSAADVEVSNAATMPKLQDPTGEGSPQFTVEHKLQVLLAEFDALYELVTFRMSSLEKRLPIVGSIFAAIVATVTVIPENGRNMFLLGLPLVLILFMRTTVNHARSFEDVLRRIDEIERAINGMAREQLLAFQSRHPSKGRAVGGRTGMESVIAVFVVCLMVLGGCVYLFAPQHASAQDINVYRVYCAVSAGYLLYLVIHLRSYKYIKQNHQPNPGSPV